MGALVALLAALFGCLDLYLAFNTDLPAIPVGSLIAACLSFAIFYKLLNARSLRLALGMCLGVTLASALLSWLVGVIIARSL